MDALSAVTLVGISHRSSPVAVRERYVVSPADLPACLSSLLGLEGVCEALVVSTCNRTEALVVTPADFDPQLQVSAQLFRNVPAEQLYTYRDMQALIHVFRVAAGLDSLVIGESEVLAQLKRGAEAATDCGALGPVLKPLVQQALRVGKRVRSETPLGLGTLSVARVAADVAARVFGRFHDERALVVGAGETGVLVARHLASQGLGALCFANRSLERAQEAAKEFGARTCALGALAHEIPHHDIVVVCIDGGAWKLEAAHFDPRVLRRRDKPLLVIDLSVPRAVAPQLAQERPDLLLYDLDDLQRVVHENQRGRVEAIEGTAEIMVSELHKYLSLRTYAGFSPLIADLRQRFEAAREEHLDRLGADRSQPREVQLAHDLTKRLLDIALDQLKASARHARSEQALDREYRRFLENL